MAKKKEPPKAQGKQIVGVIANIVNAAGKAYVIVWVESPGRKKRGPGYQFPPLGPYAQKLHDDSFRKWGGKHG